ncbi:glycosyltransferase family 4 protein [Patescibacteria group bacterium]|nr:glycosyltransferase family 4 protein [Patescibacteria group bacterium]
MRIAILGSVALPVPPPAQGGTEWIAYFQASGLAKLGHDVILFAAKGSKKEKGYELVEVGGGDTVVGSRKREAGSGKPDVESSIPNSSTVHSQLSKFAPSDFPNKLQDNLNIESSRGLRKENVYLSQVMEQLIERKDDYDLILNNMRGEAVFLPVAKMLNKPFVNVMHLPLFDELVEVFRKYNTHVITISNAQRKGFDELNYLATVNNCVDTDKFTFNPTPQDYILMMGSITPHKNQASAVRIAKKLGMKLILAGKINDKKYFEELKKDIDGEKIQYFGELDFDQKVELYRNAKAFIFPILWEEPFGLVMIEAMSCGTPVVAFGNGAIPEVVVDGMTGFVISNNDEEAMERVIQSIDQIKREDCRRHVEENFTVEKMVKDYEKALLILR